MLRHDFNSSIIAEFNQVVALVVARGFSRCPDRDPAAQLGSWEREILVKKQVDEGSEDKTNGRATCARALGCSQRGEVRTGSRLRLFSRQTHRRVGATWPSGRRPRHHDAQIPVLMPKFRMRVHVGVWLLALLVAGAGLEASILCTVDQRVQAGTCVACDLVKTPYTNTAGDVKTSGDTECDGNLFGTSATWELVDDALLGSGAGFSRNVSISSDGTRIAVIYKDGTDGFQGGKGVVIVFEHNSNAASGSQWRQLGQNIYSEAAGDGYHASISLSGDGNRLAVGSPDNMNPALNTNSGHVRVSPPLGI